MTRIIRSGAFLQQCWSIHPLCVAVARMEEVCRLVLLCSSCKSAHYVTAGTVAVQESAARTVGGQIPQTGSSGELLLKTCIAVHRASLVLREMDVFQDTVVLRCAECRRHYALQVESFETHQT